MFSQILDYYKTLTPPDKLTAVYCGIMSALILSRATTIGSDTAYTYAGYYIIVLLFILLVVPLLDRIDHVIVKNPLIQFVRYLYPALLLGAFFTWTQPVCHMFFSEPFDEAILKLDLLLFGFNPGKDLVNVLGNNYWLSEYMNISYLSFYCTPWLVVYFYFAKKQKEFCYTAFICGLVMYVCYFIQSVLPVEGPIYHDPSIGHHIIAGPISAFAADFLSNADVPGSAMPSGHVAGTISIFLLSWQMFRKAFWVTAPLWISLCIATVYGHFHYAVDGIAGIMVAAFGVLWIGPMIYSWLFPDMLPDSIAGKKKASEQEDELLAPGVLE